METIRLAATRRQEFGKGVARRLRRQGQLPAVVYGHGQSVEVTISQSDLKRLQKSEAGENTIVDLNISGASSETCQVILRDLQIDPVTTAPLHVDFYRVRMDEAITMTVPLEFINEPEDRLKAANAVLTPLMREIPVSCLPRDVPQLIEVDLEALQVNEPIRAASIVLPQGVSLLVDPEDPIVTTSTELQVVEEEAEAAEGVEEEETTEEVADERPAASPDAETSSSEA